MMWDHPPFSTPLSRAQSRVRRLRLATTSAALEALHKLVDDLEAGRAELTLLKDGERYPCSPKLVAASLRRVLALAEGTEAATPASE